MDTPHREAATRYLSRPLPGFDSLRSLLLGRGLLGFEPLKSHLKIQNRLFFQTEVVNARQTLARGS